MLSIMEPAMTSQHTEDCPQNVAVVPTALFFNANKGTHFEPFLNLIFHLYIPHFLQEATLLLQLLSSSQLPCEVG